MTLPTGTISMSQLQPDQGIDYLSVTDIGVNQANRFYVGANSIDGGNTGAFFSIL